MGKWKQDFVEEDHPYVKFIPLNAAHLVIGTFPTPKRNRTRSFEFLYPNPSNHFWPVLSEVFDYKLKFFKGEQAIEDRKQLLTQNKVGLTDMHLKCYRINDSSEDKYLVPIIPMDILKMLQENVTIQNLIFTSRDEIYGALGLFQRYLIQQGHRLQSLTIKREKILEGEFKFYDRAIKIFVPYSTSNQIVEEGRASFPELVAMYKYCFQK